MGNVEPIYFLREIRPSQGVSGGVIVVKNFHPRWKDASKKLMKLRTEEILADCAERLGKWANVPIGLEFDRELGLKRIRTYSRSSLELVDEGVHSSYRSHNIDTAPEVAVVDGVISEYLGLMNIILRDLDEII